MVTFIDEWRRKFPSCMVVKRVTSKARIHAALILLEDGRWYCVMLLKTLLCKTKRQYLLKRKQILPFGFTRQYSRCFFPQVSLLLVQLIIRRPSQNKLAVNIPTADLDFAWHFFTVHFVTFFFVTDNSAICFSPEVSFLTWGESLILLPHNTSR